MSDRSDTIYLDYNSTTPVLPEVVEAMRRSMEPRHGNPSSLHARGRAGRALLEESREAILATLVGEGGELVFTSGGSESNALAILGTLHDSAPGHPTPGHPTRSAEHVAPADPPHAVVAAIEHPSTIEVYRRLERSGRISVTWVPPGENGRVPPRAIREALRPETALVSLHHANNETGVIQDVHGVAKICRSRNVAFHCDAVQTLGKLGVVQKRADDGNSAGSVQTNAVPRVGGVLGRVKGSGLELRRLCGSA